MYSSVEFNYYSFFQARNMEFMTNKKLKKDQGDQMNEEMEHLTSRDEGPAVETDEPEPAVESGCLGIFPEEVWLEILDKLIHSEDILNVFKAFPQLDKAFQNKKACWLFDQVLPHLMTKHLVVKKDMRLWNHVESSELLKLRLISKRWKRVVEMVIESNADRHPINSDGINGNQAASLGVALPVNHFNYFRINKYHLGATIFRTSGQINEFLEEMNDFQGNPFPGKYLYFLSENPDRFSEGYQEFVKNAAELLDKFGHHVLVLDLEIRDYCSCYLDVCKDILKGLSSVPNLQSLKISFWDSYSTYGNSNQAKATNDFFSKPENLELFPKLEKLESFEMEVYFERCIWVEHMIRLYGRGGGLRKLALGIQYWNAEMASNLKNLTELHLLWEITIDDNVSEIRNVLGYFPDGQLKKFRLTDYQGIYIQNIFIDELIGMLDGFQIENVAFEKLNIEEKRSGMEAARFTSLHLDDHSGLTYQFLKRLPNLRFLSVHVSFEVVSALKTLQDSEGLVEHKRKLALASGVRQYFWRADKNYEWKGDRSFDIWKECPKLEMLTASVGNGDNKVLTVQFVREHGNKPFWGWSGTEENGEVGEEGVEIN